MHQTRTAIGAAVGERYVLVGPRPDAPDTEWDAVDTLLHRAVIVAWAPSSAARPDGEALDGLAGDPTLAMPVPVSDGRRILDGGVHDGHAYLVLELQHEIGDLPSSRPWRGATVGATSERASEAADRSDAAGIDGGFDDTTVVGIGAAAASVAGGARTEATTLDADIPTQTIEAVPVPAAAIATGGPALADADATTILAPADHDGAAATTGATPVATATTAGAAPHDTAVADRPRRRRRPAAIVLGCIGLAALLFAAALVIGSQTATQDLVPEQGRGADAPAATEAPTVPTTSMTVAPALTPSTRAAVRPTTTVAPTTTSVTETTEPAPTTTAEPVTTVAPPTTIAPVTVPPTTRPPTTTSPTTAAPPTTAPIPAGPASTLVAP